MPGGVTDFPIVVLLSAAAPAGDLSNTATVTSPAADPDPTNNSSTNTLIVQQTSDIAIVKTVTSGPVVAGQPVTYALTVTNNGPSDAENAVITDTAPTGTTWASAAIPGGTCTITGADLACNLDALTLGQTVAATVVLDTPSSLTGTLTNTAAVTSSSFDPDTGDSPSTVTSPVTTSADLSLTKTVSDPTPNVGDTITYTIALADNGPSDATGVAVTDLLPSGVSFVSATPTQGQLRPGQRAVGGRDADRNNEPDPDHPGPGRLSRPANQHRLGDPRRSARPQPRRQQRRRDGDPPAGRPGHPEDRL